MPSVCTWSCSLKDKCQLTISASSCATSMYAISLFEGQVAPHPHDFGLFMCQQIVRDLALWRTGATSRFRPLRVSSECTSSHTLKDKCHLTILASSCAISLYVISLFERHVSPYDFGLFVCHQPVRDLALWRTSATSPFRLLRVPSACTWSRSLKDRCQLTISASSCANRMYMISLSEGQVPPDDFGLFVYHQTVRDLALWRTSAPSRFLPLRMPSVRTWSRTLKDKCHLMITVSSCAIRMYVISHFEGQVPPHDFGLFVCHQNVRDLTLWRTGATSRFRPIRVPLARGSSRSLNDKCHLTTLPSSRYIRKLVVLSFETVIVVTNLHLLMQLAYMVCILEKEITICWQDIDNSIIHCHFLYNRLWVIVFTFLHPGDQSWTFFLFTAGMFPSLVFLIVNHGTSCIDLFWPAECMYNWEYLCTYWSGIVASFAVGMYNVMFAWEWVRHFQQRVSCIINHDLIVYSVQNFIMVTIHVVSLLLIALLHPAAVSRSHNMEPISVQLKHRTPLWIWWVFSQP